MALTKILTPIQTELTMVETRLRQVVEGQDDHLTAIIEQLLSAGGKRIRPALCLLTANIFAADLGQCVMLAAAIEMLHTATLVHDDLIDGALLRRGHATLNAHWTPDVTVLTGDYLFARAASLVAQTNNLDVINLFAKTLMTIVNGEIKQKFSQGPNRQDYYERIYAKTAALFVLAVKAAALLGDADASHLYVLDKFACQIGMAFQIVDDVLDFVGSPDQIGKPTGSDLRQGLVTLPTIYYLEVYPNDPDMRMLLNGGSKDQALISRVLASVRSLGATDQALSEAREFASRAQSALHRLPQSIYVRALESIAQYVVDRPI